MTKLKRFRQRFPKTPQDKCTGTGSPGVPEVVPDRFPPAETALETTKVLREPGFMAGDFDSLGSQAPEPLRSRRWFPVPLSLKRGNQGTGHVLAVERESKQLPELLSFELLGEPVPKARARTVRAKGVGVVRTFTPAATRAFEEKVRLTCMVAVRRSAWTWTKACRFAVTVRVVRVHADAGGDVDNYAKAILDGINGVAFADDRYVRALVASLEAPDRVRPRIEVDVQRLAPVTRAA